MIAPINPCGFAVLPMFLAQAADFPNGEGSERIGTLVCLNRGLHAGAALAIGLAGTFTVIGLLLAAGMRCFVNAVSWLAVLPGAVMAALGVGMLSGWHLSLRLAIRRSSGRRQHSAGSSRRAPVARAVRLPS